MGVPNYNSITLTWQIVIGDEPLYLKEDNGNSLISVIRQISVRKFGSTNATQLFVLEDFNKTALLSNSKRQEADSSRYYTLPNLEEDSSYVVCFETLDSSDQSANEKVN